MRYLVTIHKQTTTTVEIEDAANSEDAILQAHSGKGNVLDTKTISAQFLPQEAPPPPA